MIYIRPMTVSEFDEFKTKSQITYATDFAKAEGISAEQALKYAVEQFNRLLPDGVHTTGQFFYQAVKNETEQPVGYLWLGLQNRFGRQVMSVNDIAIFAEHRRNGFGKLLMSLVEQESRAKSAERIRLHVFNNNEVAKRLYLSMGFEPTSIDMKKDL